ncbi:MAG TPA: 16S rRNA (adenine(1518)-N(6)/adenine(1519)-N(6))-dimethyltransferase RsmA [Candidatus Eisenbacteria bacterium]|nr:16S rRNA (adenine(1518)-N(6)/adenine(1519)-N(6))-dimethyltransferase RsmA [Candidatus Eisenbacteria bacterium]
MRRNKRLGREAGGPRRASSYVRERAALEGSELQRVKRTLAEYGLAPRRKLGQNFLVREDIAERIAEHSRLREDDVAVEIGPGLGALTTRIVHRVRHLVAIEKDAGFAAILRENFAGVPHVEIVEADVLETDLGAIARAHDVPKLAIAGNIPYNITTPILEWLFAHRAFVRSAVLLVQKEYAERLAAAAGSPEYGSLTLFARYHALLEPLMTVRAAAFWPRPEVDSMLVRFFLRDHPPVDAPEELLFRIIRGAFQMRRKQLGNTLAASLDLNREQVERLVRAAGIDPERRGETLTLDEYARLARAAVEVGEART